MRLRASLAILLFLSGCSTIHTIPKSELARLDGWKDDGNTMLQDVGAAFRGERADVRQLLDDEGRPHKFDEDTPLLLVLGDDEEVLEKYIQVNVDSTRFLGVPKDRPGRPVDIPLTQVQHAGVKEFSLGKTLALGGGIVGGLLIGLITFSLVYECEGDCGGGGFDD
jgi:hypothetical protein